MCEMFNTRMNHYYSKIVHFEIVLLGSYTDTESGTPKILTKKK